MIWKNKAKASFMVFLFFLAVPFAVKAAGSESIGIFPAYPDEKIPFSNSWFIYKLDLGQEKVDAIRVFNNKKQDTVVVKLYPVDAETTKDGSFALLQEDADRKDVGSWIKLAVNQIEIPPMSEKTVPFTFTIPKNADAGDHMGGIIMQEVELDKEMVGTGMKIITRVGVRIYETVPGEVKKDFEITKFDWSERNKDTANFFKNLLDINKDTVFFVGIKNKGNVQLSPKVTIDVKNIFGRTVAHLADQEVGTVFPRGENSQSSVRWDKALIFGRYKVMMKTSIPDMPDQTRQLVIWKIPWRIIFLLVILGVIVILGRLIIQYFQEALKEKMPIYEVRQGDSLMKLAEKFFVDWKKIASVNCLKVPFEIRVGEKLFIPVNSKNKNVIAEAISMNELFKSIAEREGGNKNKSKRILLIILLCAIGIVAAYGIKVIRDKQEVRQEIPAKESPSEELKETAEKTISGAFKKSSVRVDIRTLESGDSNSSMRILKRLDLTGYKVNYSSIKENKYAKTTIEYNKGKKDQAEMLKNDLGVSDEIELVEVSGLATDAIIYNSLDKNNFLDF